MKTDNNAMTDLSRVMESLLSIVSPARCLLCGAPLSYASVGCSTCFPLLPTIDRDACPGCALPSPDSLRCGRCRSMPPAFDHATAAFWFEPPIDRIVRGLKFHRRLAAGPPLGRSLADAVAHSTPDGQSLPQIIVPVPLGPQRQRQRGFNQATEIARSVGHALGIPVDTDAISRVRDTHPQTEIPAAERDRNMRDAFSYRRGSDERPDNRPGNRAGNPLAGHIAIVDDVMTTAATVNAMADTCRRAGAHRISVWVVARVTT